MIGIVSDHRGYELKKEIISKLKDMAIDYGTNSSDSVDYPDYAKLLAEKVINHEIDFGIAICGTGIGMSIACNKFNDIRCAKVNNIKEAFLARSHNNANIMAISSETNIDDVLEWIDTFIKTKFSDEEKHHRRVSKISEIEKNK
ncbi:MAG TPA: RpiB/LacA/LacB family sugar-phosphate isomerase [Bacilli bacterium]|nr:RpiB/LacA/LacB family sugar-phosphate isomerase [Bacilli bacterium]